MAIAKFDPTLDADFIDYFSSSLFSYMLLVADDEYTFNYEGLSMFGKTYFSITSWSFILNNLLLLYLESLFYF